MSYADRETLKTYLSQIRAYPHLEKEEERDLARRYRDTGDTRARDRLVQSHLYLVYQVVRKYPSRQIPVIEQLQEGNLGLLHAADKFDPERGVRFSAYSRYWIRAYVLHQLMSHYRLVRIGTSVRQRKLFFQLRKARKKLEQQGVEPTYERLAEALDVRPEEVEAMSLRLGAQAEISLDDRPDGDRSLIERLESHSPDAEALTAHKELRDHLSAAMDALQEDLDDRERSIWERRIINENPLSLRKLGDALGLSRERVRQLEAIILKKLRGRLPRNLVATPV